MDDPVPERLLGLPDLVCICLDDALFCSFFLGVGGTPAVDSLAFLGSTELAFFIDLFVDSLNKQND